MSVLWTPPGYEGDRHVLMAGRVEIGAVFPPIDRGGKFWRWRVFNSVRRNPVDGVSRSEGEAKAIVETHLREFMREAGMVFAPAPGGEA